MFLRWLSLLDYVSIYSFIIIIDSKRVFLLFILDINSNQVIFYKEI